MYEHSKYPSDLIEVAATYFRKRRGSKVGVTALKKILEVAYTASMQKEEAREVSFIAVYADPNDPDPDCPPRIRPHRPSFHRLAERVPFTTRNITKLTHATSPTTASIAVFLDENRNPFIWALVDQETHFRNALDYEVDSFFSPAGLFQVEVTGVATVSIYADLQLIARLDQSRLLKYSNDVFSNGPIRSALQPMMRRYLAGIKSLLPGSMLDSPDYWLPLAERRWISALCRLLIRIKRNNHGGALILLPTRATPGLRIKYGISYDRLEDVLGKQVLGSLIASDHESRILFEIKNSDDYKIPPVDYLDARMGRNIESDATEAIAGCLSLISSLTQVDGAVVMSKGLRVKGFGAEIVGVRTPPAIYSASTAAPKERQLKPLDFEQFGTRHRSMMRYCARYNGSVGFVISQDGAVRAMTKVGEKLITWDNIRIQRR